MDITEVSNRIVASKGVEPVGAQRELLRELTEFYGELGLLDGELIPSLTRACSAAGECWKKVAENERPQRVPSTFDARSENGCIFLPWVGPSYQRGGICVVGTNIRRKDARPQWEYAFEHRIALDPKWGQVPELRRGRNPHKSRWARHSMRDVVAVQRSMRGESELKHRDHDELAEAMLSSARVQAVKCSPLGGLGTPTPTMSEQCPRRYLQRELDILRPSVLLVYGTLARWGVARLGKVAIEEQEHRFRRGTIQLAGFRSEVFFLTHPAHGGWHPAHRALVASLEKRPIVAHGVPKPVRELRVPASPVSTST